VDAPQTVEQFKAEAGKAGAVVHHALTIEDAYSYILKLVQERNIRTIVTSKSELLDKLDLRARLSETGITVKDTDLNKWLGPPKSGEPAELQVLLESVNRPLRQSCIDADLGISEAHNAIAETGTLVIAGNDGFTRLVAVLPGLHLTLIECKNIIPAMEDVFIKIGGNARKRTGQVVPSYITYITGRNTTADIPGAVLARAQGPAEEHIVLVGSADEGGVT